MVERPSGEALWRCGGWAVAQLRARGRDKYGVFVQTFRLIHGFLRTPSCSFEMKHILK